MHANGFVTIFRNADIHIIPGKLSKIHLHAWLFSNPHGKDFCLHVLHVGINQRTLMLFSKFNWYCHLCRSGLQEI